MMYLSVIWTLKTLDSDHSTAANAPSSPDTSVADTNLNHTADSSENYLNVDADIVDDQVVDSSEDSSDNSDFMEIVPVRKSSGLKVPPAWKKKYFVCSSKITSPHPIENVVSYSRYCPAHLTFALSISAVKEPSHFKQAVEDPKWLDAMQKEVDAL